MILHDIRKFREGDGLQTLSAIVTYETPTPRSFRVYFTLEGAPGEIASSADPFVIGFVVPAMLLGEDLEVRGAVDPELLSTIETNIMPRLRRWFPFLHPVGLMCESPRAPVTRERPGLHVLSFSGGLDACYSAVKHRETTDALLVSWGFDVRSHQEALWRRTLPEIQAGAENLGKPLITIRTNLREVSHYEALRTRRGHVDPGFYQLGRTGANGPFLAAIGRCLEPFCSRYRFAASDSAETLEPFGSHPELDPWWSTSSQQVIYDGFEAGRIEKVAFLKDRRPSLLGAIHVCWRPDRTKSNCSRCEKCLRTMAEIRLAGATELAASFQWPLDLNAIAQLNLDRPFNRVWWVLILKRARESGDAELAKAASRALRKKINIRQLGKRVFGPGRTRRQGRQHWKYVRRVLKPPPGASGEVPTPRGTFKSTERESGPEGELSCIEKTGTGPPSS